MSSNHPKNSPTPDDQSNILHGLRDRPVAPAELEEKTIRRLEEKTLLVKAPAFSSIRNRLVYAAAAIFLLFAGYSLGKWGASPATNPPDTGSSLYFLALYESPGDKPGNASLYREYGDWLRGIGNEGRYVDGEALNIDTGKLLVTGQEEFFRTQLQNDSSALLTGFFIIEADSLAEAADIARTSPHLNYGGAILIKKIKRNP